MTTTTEPNATLYLKNIDWKIKKSLLRRALYALFSRHGKVMEIVVLRRDGLRGQAWVIMDDITSATAALQAESGRHLFGKDLVIDYAKNASERSHNNRQQGMHVRKAKRKKQTEDAIMEEGTEEIMKEGEGGGEAAAAASRIDNAPLAAPTPRPSRFIKATNLPPECNQIMLNMLFRQYAGYQEATVVVENSTNNSNSGKSKTGKARVEFVDEPSATLALQGLQKFKLTATDVLQLEYGHDDNDVDEEDK